MSELNRLKKALGEDKLKESCWKGYAQLGMKEKDGKSVPNCIPTSKVPKKAKIKEEKDVHGYYVPHYDEHGNKRMGKFFKKKEEAEKHLNANPTKTDSYYPVNDKYERISESSDYFRRRQKEEDIISGKKPARKRIPKGNDYFQRRAKEEKNMLESNDDVHHFTDYKLWKQHAVDNKYKLVHGAWDSFARDRKGNSVGMFDGKRNIGHMKKK